MAKKQSYKRQRSPILLLVCEGKNKTERKYFSHYKVRELPYRLEIRDSEATDVMGMARRAANLYKEYQMDPKIGDLVFCLIDLDLRRDKYDAYLKAQQRYPQIKFIVSNPCFEIWMYAYFGEMPTIGESYTCCDRFADKFEKVTGQKYLKRDKDIYRKLMQFGDEKKAIQIAERCYRKCVNNGKHDEPIRDCFGKHIRRFSKRAYRGC